MVEMSSAELAGVTHRSLGEKVISLKAQRDEIIAALDLLFTGIRPEFSQKHQYNQIFDKYYIAHLFATNVGL